MSVNSGTDERILDLLVIGATTYGQLVIHLKDLDDRLIDRRLQALKKQGRIKYLGQSWGWRVVKP